MKSWLRRLRGALGMGITWAIAWALVGVGIAAASVVLPFLPWHLWFNIFDAPAPALAVPGFICGVLFSLVLGVAARNRRFDELSVPGMAALGALGGILLSLVPAALVSVGLASVAETRSLAAITVAIGVPSALLGAASAAGTLAVARRGERSLGSGSSDPALLSEADDA